MADTPRYQLCLYVAGASPRSLQAIANLQRLSAGLFSGRCALTVVDIVRQPERALAAGVMVAPTLVREYPQPVRRLLGDCSDTRRVCADLELS